MEWFIHIVITTVFLLSKKSLLRWPHEWLKHVAYHNTIKHISKIIKVYLLVFNIMYESYVYFRFIFIIKRKVRTSNICKWDNTHANKKRFNNTCENRYLELITTSQPVTDVSMKICIWNWHIALTLLGLVVLWIHKRLINW